MRRIALGGAVLALGYLLGALTHDLIVDEARAVTQIERMPEPRTPDPDVISTLRALSEMEERLRIHADHLKKLEVLAKRIERERVELFHEKLRASRRR